MTRGQEASSNSLMWQHHNTIQKALILNLDILSNDSQAIDSHPLANSASPAYQTSLYKREGSDLCFWEYGCIINSYSSTYNAIFTNDYIGA